MSEINESVQSPVKLLQIVPEAMEMTDEKSLGSPDKLLSKIGSLDVEQAIESDVEVNHGFLVCFTLNLMMAAAIQGGFAHGENGQVGYILD